MSALRKYVAVVHGFEQAAVRILYNADAAVVCVDVLTAEQKFERVTISLGTLKSLVEQVQRWPGVAS